MEQMEQLETTPNILETKLPLEERNQIQAELIREFCNIRGIEDTATKRSCAMDWVEKYADYLDQLDDSLIECYRTAENEEQRKTILSEIQTALDGLNEING